ncbi:hypothetical protein B0H21DRAFT_828177 [Amylocystis lapponica]|nr:hypothetical protein B0H21DRAFT_828177 [Amylocystis lapponica]
MEGMIPRPLSVSRLLWEECRENGEESLWLLSCGIALPDTPRRSNDVGSIEQGRGGSINQYQAPAYSLKRTKVHQIYQGMRQGPVVWDASVKSGSCVHVLRSHTSTIRCLKVLHGQPLAEGAILHLSTMRTRHGRMPTCPSRRALPPDLLVAFDGRTVPYDYCVLATCSDTTLPTYADLAVPGVFVYRNITDMNKFLAYAERDSVVGSTAVYDLEPVTHITIVHRQPYLLSRQLDAHSGEIVVWRVTATGVTFLAPRRPPASAPTLPARCVAS